MQPMVVSYFKIFFKSNLNILFFCDIFKKTRMLIQKIIFMPTLSYFFSDISAYFVAVHFNSSFPLFLDWSIASLVCALLYFCFYRSNILSFSLSGLHVKV